MERLILAFIAFLWLGMIQETIFEPELDLTTTTVLVNWYDTELELQDALDDSSIAGLSECEMRPDFNTSFCELWLVTPVDSEDGYAFDTIGHEFYHAFKGNFHPY